MPRSPVPPADTRGLHSLDLQLSAEAVRVGTPLLHLHQTVAQGAVFVEEAPQHHREAYAQAGDATAGGKVFVAVRFFLSLLEGISYSCILCHKTNEKTERVTRDNERVEEMSAY